MAFVSSPPFNHSRWLCTLTGPHLIIIAGSNLCSLYDKDRSDDSYASAVTSSPCIQSNPHRQIICSGRSKSVECGMYTVVRDYEATSSSLIAIGKAASLICYRSSARTACRARIVIPFLSVRLSVFSSYCGIVRYQTYEHSTIWHRLHACFSSLPLLQNFKEIPHRERYKILVMWSETVGPRTRPVWDQKIGLGLNSNSDLYCVEWDVKLYYTIPYHTILVLVLVKCCETWSCHARHHHDLEGRINFSSTIYSFSILCLEHHYCGDQQWRSLT